MYKPLSTLNLSMETWEETIRPNFPSITPIFRCGWHHPTKSQKIPRKLPLIRLADWRSINFVQTVPFSIAWYDTNFPQRCWTPLVIVKDHSRLAYPNMHKITNLWNLGSIGHRSCKTVKTKEKTPLLHNIVFSHSQMPGKSFRTEVFLRFKYLSKKLPLSKKKLRYFREGRFSQCFYQLLSMDSAFQTDLCQFNLV